MNIGNRNEYLYTQLLANRDRAGLAEQPQQWPTAEARKAVGKIAKACHRFVDDAARRSTGGKVGPNLFGTIEASGATVRRLIAMGDDLVAARRSRPDWTRQQWPNI